MTISPERGWLVADRERAYGPYDLAQLASFLTPEHWVFHLLTGDWTRAALVEPLKPVLAGDVPVAIEWYYRAPNGREQGPFTRAAIVRMIKDHVITEEAMIRHQDWPRAKPAPETAFGEDLNREQPMSPVGRRHPFSVPPIEITAAKRHTSIHLTRETLQQLLLAVVLLGAIVSGVWWYMGYTDSQRAERQMNDGLLAVIRDGGQVPDGAARRFTMAFNSAITVETVSLEDWQRAMAAVAVMAHPNDHTAAEIQAARQDMVRALRAARASAAAQAEVLDAFDQAVAGRDKTDTRINP